MLNPKTDRLDFGVLLMPPDKYSLTKAVGTSYSLDLDALMIMPVAMFYSESTDRPKQELRVDMVDAIVNASSKITLYYQEGKLKVPKKYHFLMAFWEKGLHKIRMPDFASSFHPKVWIIRFDGENLPGKYRVIITSRNLTFASDYDVAFETEGSISANTASKNIELIEFLRYLNKQSKTIEDSFINDLKKVSFDLPEKFADLKFHPIGISKKHQNPIFQKKWTEMLVISPFLDITTTNSLSKNTAKMPVILSTQEELSCLKNVEITGQAWQFSKFIQQSVYNEEINENEVDPSPQSLHAKMYVSIFDNTPFWFLGSANCTSPATDRNIEFLVEMKATGRGLKPNDLLITLTDNKVSVPIFEKFIHCNTETIVQQKKQDLEIRKILYDLFRVDVDISIKKNDHNGLFDYSLTLNLENHSLPDDFSIQIKPVSKIDEDTVNLQYGTTQCITSFVNYSESLLTPFFSVFILYEKEVIASSTWVVQVELPPTRLNKIFTAIINSRERFMQYLYFLLNGGTAEILAVNDNETKKYESYNEGVLQLFDGKPIFENLLIAVSRDINKLKNIKEIIAKLQSEEDTTNDIEKIISAEFLDFWQVFENFILKVDSNA